MKLTIGLSPCPNDTFIFDAMLNGKIDTEGLEFSYEFEDVETLNKLARNGTLDVTKISYGVLGQVLPHYKVLNAGGALGRGVGPLFISITTKEPSNLESLTVALPGIHTTAHLLFSMAYPEIQKKIFMPFHEIENAILNGTVDAGVIIHENRFTYQQKGLFKWADLGEIWEKNTGHPIPLGGIVARRSYNSDLLKKINRIIHRSLAFANQNQTALPLFVTENAQEMEESVMRNHIDLYVNDFSLDLATAGRSAVWKLLELSANLQRVPVGGNFEVFVD
ncbi:MAG: 1,4-dihydroxy-6-naphthoate synthase [Chitinophagaceae bacterium]